MKIKKTEILSFRVEPRIKDALGAAAEQEHRSKANMIEVMVLDYCERHSITTHDKSRQKSI
jgi:hypothetical protein